MKESTLESAVWVVKVKLYKSGTVYVKRINQMTSETNIFRIPATLTSDKKELGYIS